MPKNEEKHVASVSTSNNQSIKDTKLQRVVKTLLINVSFIALVSKILVEFTDDINNISPKKFPNGK